MLLRFVRMLLVKARRGSDLWHTPCTHPDDPYFWSGSYFWGGGLQRSIKAHNCTAL